MGQIIISINTDNAAFSNSDDPQTDTLSREVLRILTTADFYEGGPLRDINGNNVGSVKIA